jgi:arylsulfatase A-like enzyme/Flp pilus assembly protein TadD
LALSPAARAAGAELNVLLVTVDTIRADRLGCYGPGAAPTPRIDGLAAKGILFERAFAHDPETLPSHTNILLGLTSPAHGVCENSKSIVAPDFLTLAEHFKAHGYATAAFVSGFPLDSRFGLNQGFDVYDDRFPAKPAAGELFSERRAEKTVAAALQWLGQPKGKWFCWVHFWDPHDPYDPPEPYRTRYADDPYSGEVAYVDAQLGVLLDELAKRGLADRTLVVLTGDHGESFGEHGETFHGYFAYNTTLRVPLIIVVPGAVSSRVKAPVGHIDIFPTVCDIAGLEKPAGLQGETLLPFLRGRTRKARPIYFEALEAYLNRGWAPIRGVIDNGMKYIDSPIPELYDLEADFGETRNLAPQTDLAPFQKELHDLMAASAAALSAQGTRPATDRDTRERLRSLGYAASRLVQLRSSFGPEDDLKTLLPLEQKVNEAARLQKLGRTAESVRLLVDVINERKDFARAYEQLYEIYRSRGLVEDALGVFAKGTEANRDNFLFVSEYGIALVRNGRYQKGIEVLESSLRLFDQDAEVWDSLGTAYGSLGDLGKAREDLERALALAPDDAIINGNTGALYVTMALRDRDRELARQAIPFFEKALEADPALPSVYNGLAGAQRLVDRRDDAIANWERAVALDPRFDLPLYNLAVAYLEKGDKGRAFESCQKYLQVRGSNITPDEKREIDAIIQKCR